MKIDFRNKGLDAIDLSNILFHKDVKAAILSYFKKDNPTLISYSYMPPIATKIFNYIDVLRHLNTKDVIGDPSPFTAAPPPGTVTNQRVTLIRMIFSILRLLCYIP